MRDVTRKRLAKEWLLLLIFVGLALISPFVLAVPKSYTTRYTIVDDRGRVRDITEKQYRAHGLLDMLSQRRRSLRESFEEKGEKNEWTLLDTEKIWSWARYTRGIRAIFHLKNLVASFAVLYGGFWLIRSITFAIRILK